MSIALTVKKINYKLTIKIIKNILHPIVSNIEFFIQSQTSTSLSMVCKLHSFLMSGKIVYISNTSK